MCALCSLESFSGVTQLQEDPMPYSFQLEEEELDTNLGDTLEKLVRAAARTGAFVQYYSLLSPVCTALTLFRNETKRWWRG